MTEQHTSEQIVKCANTVCGWTGPVKDTAVFDQHGIKTFFQRGAGGQPLPHGQCHECGGFCYPAHADLNIVDNDRGDVRTLTDTVSAAIDEIELVRNELHTAENIVVSLSFADQRRHLDEIEGALRQAYLTVLLCIGDIDPAEIQD